MTGFDIQEFEDYDDFVRTWHVEELDIPLDEARDQGLINGNETRLLWQLLGQLDDDELLIQIPDWLADEKVGFIDGSTPTEFVGRIDSETGKTILFVDSAAARSLTKFRRLFFGHIQSDFYRYITSVFLYRRVFGRQPDASSRR